MKILRALVTAAFAVSPAVYMNPAHADTVKARCDIYPKGNDRATSSGACTFSQRQGVVGIQLANGKRYDLAPAGNQPGTYLDQKGRPAFRETGLADKGQIYRLANESIFVYWDPAPYGATAGNPGSGASVQKPEYWVVTAATTFIKAAPGIFAKTVTNNVPNGTVLRNLGCQSQRTPTWCQVEPRDNPQFKGWVWSPNVKEYSVGATLPKPIRPGAPQVGTSVARLNDLVGARAGQAENAVTQRGYRFVRSEASGDAVYSYWREIATNYCVIIRTTNGRYESIVYGTSSCN